MGYVGQWTGKGLIAVGVAALALACGGSPTPGHTSSLGGGGQTAGSSAGSGDGGAGSGAGEGSSGGGAGTGSSSGATGSSGGGSSSGGPGSGPPNSTQSITLTMGPFTVPAGTEVYKCQNVANPFGGKDTDIAGYEEHMTEGSHHMFLFFVPNATSGPVGDCPNGGFEFHPYPFGAQSKDSTLIYPTGVGSRIPGSMGFMMNAHFVNTTNAPYQATLTVTLHIANPGSVSQYAGVVFMNNLGITIPPGTTPTTASATCILPQDMNVMLAGSHMHQRATQFVASTPSAKLYETTTWADPTPRVFTPTLKLTQGTPVTYSCTYLNDTGQTLTFGESAEKNVMCIYTMQFYPVADPNNPTIQCQM